MTSELRTTRAQRNSSKNVHDNNKMINVLQGKLFQWTCERHATNQPLNREILGDKIIDLSTELGLRDFKCSKSWITKFLKKHGFSSSLVTSYGPIFNDYQEWIELMRSYIMQYRYKNLYQVDEMGMYHDISPENIPESVDYVTCKNGENGSSRVTVLLCCNASGVDKLPPIICGKFESPIDGVNNNFQYYTNKNAWLTSDIFKLWLSQLNTKMCKLNRKILLLLNRTRVHTLKEAVLSNVHLMFFPTGFPQNLQPLRSDIFHYVKMIYRRNYTKKILLPNFNWTMTDTITNIVNAWDSIPNELILTSFRKTNFRIDNSPSKIFCPEWEFLNPRISFRNYVTFDDNLSVSSLSIRRSERLAELERVTNNSKFRTLEKKAGNRRGGFYELIELEDSELDEDVIEEVSHSSEMSAFSCNLPFINSYEHPADGLTGRENKGVVKSQCSDLEDRESAVSRLLQRGEDLEYSGFPLTDTDFLYISDIVKNAMEKAVDNIPDLIELTEGCKSQAGTSNITYCTVEEDDEAAPIKRKRRLEKTNADDVANDDSREPTEKKKMGEERWSDIYEHRFVFGTTESPSETYSAQADIQTAFPPPAINSSQKKDVLEKENILQNLLNRVKATVVGNVTVIGGSCKIDRGTIEIEGECQRLFVQEGQRQRTT